MGILVFGEFTGGPWDSCDGGSGAGTRSLGVDRITGSGTGATISEPVANADAGSGNADGVSTVAVIGETEGPR